ncbi:MAG TPA: TonB-dependent receptor, partial [Bacteroidota bacterium]
VKEVKVIQGLTTEVNASLPDQSLELGETIVVIAERPLVRKDVSSTTSTIAADEFRNLPIESIQSLISINAGVVSVQGQTFIRGSRSTDVTYVVDGVPLTNPITGATMTDINKDAVDEIVLMTGGFSAEYGNAMGGVVNVSTRDGGEKLAGTLRYKTDHLSSGSEFYENANVLDATLGGPLFGSVKFFVTGYLNLRDMNAERDVIAPNGANLGLHPHNGYQEFRTTAKLTVPVAEGLRLRISASSNRKQQLLYNLYWRFGSNPDQLDRYGAYREKTRYAAAIVEHVISPKTFYTLKLGWLDWRTKNGQRDRAEWSGNDVGSNSNFWNDFEFRIPFLDRNYRIPGDPNVYSKWRLRDSRGVGDVFSVRTSDSVSVNNPYGVPGGIQNTVDAGYFQNFVWSGDRDFYEANRNEQYSARFDLTTQPTNDHEIKAGFEAAWHRINRFQIGGMGSLDGKGITYPVIDFYEKSPSDTALTVANADNLGKGYTPVELAAYGTYQLRLEGMYFNLGLRFDYYNAQTEFRVNPLEPTESNPFKQSRQSSVSKTQLSPRLGISFPITDQTVFRFNYGQFFQRPPMDRMFSFLWVDLNQADVYQGNPNIEPQKTVAYEVGMSTVVSEDIALSITGFQKNMFNLEGYRLFRAPDLEWYFLAVNHDYAESYGLEVSFRKRYSNWTSGSLNYTFSVARGTASDVTQVSRYPLTSTTYAKQLGYEPLYPQETMPMNFDRTHVLNFVFNLSIPQEQGPEIFGAMPLGGFGVSVNGYAQSGVPYTPQTSYFVNLTTDRFNSASYPTQYGLDARIRKDFQWGGYELSVFAEVFNVLDLEVPVSVFHGSGNADRPDFTLSQGSISPDSYASNHPLYSARADADKDGILEPGERFEAYKRMEQDMLAMKTNYVRPRKILFGLEVRF